MHSLTVRFTVVRSTTQCVQLGASAALSSTLPPHSLTVFLSAASRAESSKQVKSTRTSPGLCGTTAAALSAASGAADGCGCGAAAAASERARLRPGVGFAFSSLAAAAAP